MSFLDKWLSIIRHGDVSNTYKVAWAKAITETAMDMDREASSTGIIEISLPEIARKILAYYWDQTIFFDLTQGSDPRKPPVALRLTKKLIMHYQDAIGKQKPVKFIKSNVEHICIQEYKTTVNQMINVLKTDVSYRFVKLYRQNVQGIYDYSKGDDSLFMRGVNLKQLKENHTTVFEAINYRWAQILEDYNQSPRICKKVKIIDEQKVKRKPLKGFAQYLDVENSSHHCFICGNVIANEAPAIDHVVPWSFLYSDDLWNLVYAHQSCNSVKSNIIPSEDMIHKLEQRNVILLKLLQSQGIADKQVAELELAIDRNLVKKFWIACQG